MSDYFPFWMFCSVIAICVTWWKIASHRNSPKMDHVATFSSINFDAQGAPIDGVVTMTRAGEIYHFKVVRGQAQHS